MLSQVFNSRLPIENATYDYLILVKTTEQIPEQLHLFT